MAMKQSKFRGVGGKILLVVLGLLPGVGGWLMNGYIMKADSLRYLTAVSAGFFLLWGLLAFAARPLAKSAKEAALLLNAVAAVDLPLVFFQEMILGAYWFNWVGSWSQMFFLPSLSVGAALTFWSHRMISSYLVSFVLMGLVSWLGARVRERQLR